MTFIATMVSTAVGGGLLGGAAGAAAAGAAGAGLGAATSAITGGDIGEGALMGGISGVAGGALSVAAPALQGAQVATEAAKGVGTEAVKEVGKEAATEAIKTGTEEAIKTGTEEAIKTGTEQAIANQGIVALPNGATTMPTSGAFVGPPAPPAPVVGPPAPPANGGGITDLAAGTHPGEPGFVGPSATPDQIANASAYTDANMGTRLLADAFGQQGNIVGNTGLKMAGGALQNSVINSGISGLIAGAQGEDVGKAMAMGAGTGAVGGAASEGLASMAGPGGSLSEGVGNFAAKHDVLVPTTIGMGANAALSSALESSDASGEENSSSPFKTKWRVSKDYKPYISKGTVFPYAEGGITDLDVYDQTPQMQSPGTLDIPNRNEVANNQGYMGNSVQMMAHGGMAYADGGALGGMPGANIMKSVYGTTLGDAISPGLRDFLFGTPDDQLSDEQKAKKKELLAQQNQAQTVQQPQQDQEQGMAHGGISDLGGYSDGGRLLKGPGDGVSDDIPASIGGKQPARLAEGEFVVPARIVSELGNGSTDAGAKRLYQMMERIQSDRKKTTGKGKFSDNPKAYKHLPA